MARPLGSINKRSRVKSFIGFASTSLLVLGLVATAGVLVGIICQVFMLGWYLVN